MAIPGPTDPPCDDHPDGWETIKQYRKACVELGRHRRLIAALDETIDRLDAERRELLDSRERALDLVVEIEAEAVRLGVHLY